MLQRVYYSFLQINCPSSNGRFVAFPNSKRLRIRAPLASSDVFSRRELFFDTKLNLKNPAGMEFLGVELKLRKYTVLNLKTRKKLSLCDAFSGRVGGRAHST